jgi:hypothetical protein
MLFHQAKVLHKNIILLHITILKGLLYTKKLSNRIWRHIGLLFLSKVPFIGLFIYFSKSFGTIKPFASTRFLSVNIIPIALKVR